MVSQAEGGQDSVFGRIEVRGRVDKAGPIVAEADDEGAFGAFSAGSYIPLWLLFDSCPGKHYRDSERSRSSSFETAGSGEMNCAASR